MFFYILHRQTKTCTLYYIIFLYRNVQTISRLLKLFPPHSNIIELVQCTLYIMCHFQVPTARSIITTVASLANGIPCGGFRRYLQLCYIYIGTYNTYTPNMTPKGYYWFNAQNDYNAQLNIISSNQYMSFIYNKEYYSFYLTVQLTLLNKQLLQLNYKWKGHVDGCYVCIFRA